MLQTTEPDPGNALLLILILDRVLMTLLLSSLGLQEEDLNCVRDRWSEALIKRREYLDEQINKIINKQEKSEEDMEREARLVEQWVGLTEERNAVLVPAPGSGIPGAPAHWSV
uniref:BMERB domain-containing protein n=1 Tax=Hucho hucho TaxID=62062 RepID=A0A4W5KVS0_9TELE